MGCLTLDARRQLRSSPSSPSVPLGGTGVLTEALLFTAHGFCEPLLFVMANLTWLLWKPA